MDLDYDYLVGQRIKSLRESKKLTQEMLAAQLQVAGCHHMTRSALAKIEAGQRHVYAIDIRILLTVLNVSADDLLPRVSK